MQVEIGQTFNNFTIIGDGIRDENNNVYYECRCVCGEKRNVRKGNLGYIIGCGCKRKAYKQRTASRKDAGIKKTVKILKKAISSRKKVDDILFEREFNLDLF